MLFSFALCKWIGRLEVPLCLLLWCTLTGPAQDHHNMQLVEVKVYCFSFKNRRKRVVMRRHSLNKRRGGESTKQLVVFIA